MINVCSMNIIGGLELAVVILSGKEVIVRGDFILFFCWFCTEFG